MEKRKAAEFCNNKFRKKPLEFKQPVNKNKKLAMLLFKFNYDV